MIPRAALLLLLMLALLVTGGPGAGRAGAQSMRNRAPGYAAGDRPWLRCGIERVLDVDWRCGPRQAEWKPDGKTIDYPTHYVTVTRDAAAPTPLVVFDNADEPSLTHIESVRSARFTSDGRQQLVVVLPGWGPAIAPLMAADEESWKSRLYDKTHDANCCPTRGSIFVELRPGNGRFEPSRVWRVPPEKATR